jgi:hypothetical protein
MSDMLKSGSFISLILLLLTAGCGDGRPKRVPVSGQVLIDGQPLAAGIIRVIPKDARPAMSYLDANGRFQLTTFNQGDGCVEGTHRVVVLGNRRQGGRVEWLAPKKYWSQTSSGLTATIDGPTDSMVIELTWDGGKPFFERVDYVEEGFDFTRPDRGPQPDQPRE